MTINDFFCRLYQSNLSGKEIDTGMKVILGNVLSKNHVQSIPLDNIDYLEVMIKGADKFFILTDLVSFNFCAYYHYSDTFPLGRLYFITEKDSFKAHELFSNLKQKGYNLFPIANTEFAEMTEEATYKLRVEKYKIRLDTEAQQYKGLLNGRISATTIEQGFYYKSKNCMLCNEPGSFLISSSIANEESGLMIGYHFCEKHYQEAKQHNNFLDFLFGSYGATCFGQTEQVTLEEIISDSIALLEKKLDCSILKVSENTITALRKQSGFKIILRLEGIKNYGYMILSSKEKQVARFDSANDHKINYGPDHLHEDLTKKNVKVKTSFTIGVPLIDFISIQKIIEKHESMENA